MYPSSPGPRDLLWLPGGWDDDGRLIWLSSSRSRLLFGGGEIARAVAVAMAVVEVGEVAWRLFAREASVATMTATQGRPSTPFIPRPGPTESSISRHKPEGVQGLWFSHQTRSGRSGRGKSAASCVSSSSSPLPVSWVLFWVLGLFF